jgi:predicted PurR-regulated permease PerM
MDRYSRPRDGTPSPAWRDTADAWCKLLAAIVLGYLILAQILAILRTFAAISIILVGGILLAYFLFPPVSWLNKRLPLWAALAIVYVTCASLVGVGFYVLVPIAVSQITSLIADIPHIQSVVQHVIANPHNSFLAHLPEPVQTYVQKFPEQLARTLQANVTSFSLGLFNTFFIIVGVAVAAIAIPVVSIYMLAESALIKRFFLRAIPRQGQQRAIKILADIDAVIGGFIRGQILVAAVVGCLAIISLFLLHVPYPFVIGAWAGIADIIPYIGPFAGGLPAAIIAIIFNGPSSLIGVLVAFVIINQLEGHLLGPRIVSSTVKITPLAVIFALLIGGQLFGFFGLIVAVPLAGLVRVALVHLFPEREITNADLQPGLTHPPKTDVDPEATDA